MLTLSVRPYFGKVYCNFVVCHISLLRSEINRKVVLLVVAVHFYPLQSNP